MKKGFIFLFVFLFVLFPLVSSQSCDPKLILINQDPYPAVPGEYVKVVFQLNGVQDPGCGEISVELLQEFPFSLDPGAQVRFEANAGTFINNDFKTFILAPFSVRINEQAIDGENILKMIYSTRGVAEGILIKRKDFNITIEAPETDFEVSIKDYVKGTNTLTIEILNIGENDIEALTIEIPDQETINVKGSNRNIVGSLDSNEDTTLNFEAIPKQGKINLNILYTDSNNVRRSLEKSVDFNPTFYEDRIRDQKEIPFLLFAVLIIILALLGLWFRKRMKKKKHKQHSTHHNS